MQKSEASLPQVLEHWLSVEEIAAHLGVASITIYRWLEKGKIPAHRVGKLWKFRPSEVDSWVMSGGARDDQKLIKAER